MNEEKSKMEVAKKEVEIPTLAELVKNVDNYDKKDKLNFLLNQEPPQKWIKNHPYIKTKNDQGQSVPYQYLPIDKVEYLLRKIFKDYKVEITSQGQIFNGVFVTVRVHYLDFTTGQWMFHDGIGAQQIQTAKGSSAADLGAINNGAVAMAFPAAESYAIKDACDKFGKLFGADISRNGTLNAILGKPIKKTENEILISRIETHIKNSKTVDQLIQVQGSVFELNNDIINDVYTQKLSILQK